MPTISFPGVRSGLTTDELADLVARLLKDVQWLLNGNLNVENIRANGIEAKNIKAGSITTEKIAAGAVVADKIDAGAVTTDKLDAGAVTTDKIEAGAVTADKITVAMLSAIAADLGTITAGSITTDAEIDVGTDARIGNILYLNETDGDGLKGILFSTESGKTASITAQSGDVSIASGGFITLTIGSSQGLVVNQKVTAPSFDATSSMSINSVAVATEAYVNSGLSTKANGSGLNATIPPGSTLLVSDGIITGYF